MKMGSSSNKDKIGVLNRAWSHVAECAKQAKKLGEDDPRRIIHSLKVGLAITIVSLVYYFDPLFDGFGLSAMWAVLTVIVVFDFSVGATLGRGVNRAIATCLAGGMGIGAHRLASLAGERLEPIFIGLFVFIIAAVVTFIRFFPKMKARYDYGLLIFILTFCLISVSGYRDEEIIEMAHKRLSTILIGGAVAVLVCVGICPVWAGRELHNKIATNIETLGSFLEGFGVEYFTCKGTEPVDKKQSLEGYKSILNNKSNEEALANFAKWEPRHRQFRYRHPWEHYLKIGSLTRQCAYTIEALNNCLISEIQTPFEIRARVEELCMKMSSECGIAFKELGLAIRGMNEPSAVGTHVTNSKVAAKNLKTLLRTDLWKDTHLLEIIPVVKVASLLEDVVVYTAKIEKSVHELASLARFTKSEVVPTSTPRQSKMSTPRQSKMSTPRQSKMKHQYSRIDEPHHAITIEGPPPEDVNPSQKGEIILV